MRCRRRLHEYQDVVAVAWVPRFHVWFDRRGRRVHCSMGKTESNRPLPRLARHPLCDRPILWHGLEVESKKGQASSGERSVDKIRRRRADNPLMHPRVVRTSGIAAVYGADRPEAPLIEAEADHSLLCAESSVQKIPHGRERPRGREPRDGSALHMLVMGQQKCFRLGAFCFEQGTDIVRHTLISK